MFFDPTATDDNPPQPPTTPAICQSRAQAITQKTIDRMEALNAQCPSDDLQDVIEQMRKVQADRPEDRA